jgi:hypothetical protein
LNYYAVRANLIRPDEVETRQISSAKKWDEHYSPVPLIICSDNLIRVA